MFLWRWKIMKTKMVCIMCPLGCEMEVEQTNSEILVSGNNCIRGKNYAVSELTEPQRVLTSVIITKSGESKPTANQYFSSFRVNNTNAIAYLKMCEQLRLTLSQSI